jgi:hypothetical protein
MTMDGRIVHRWQSDVEGATVARFKQVLPNQKANHLDGWNHIELLPDGDLLVIGSHHMLLRLGWDSTLIWKLDLPVHHDLAIGSNGDIHVLTDGLRVIEEGGESLAFQDNYVVTVSADGEMTGRFSVYDAFRGMADLQTTLDRLRREQATEAASAQPGDSPDPGYEALYTSATRGDFVEHKEVKNLLFHGRTEDLFHANSIQILGDQPPLWREGDFLLSILKLDMIVVIDHETRRVKWRWGRGELERPHHATELANGDILVFDNGVRRGHSRIVRLDPRTREIVWSYRARPPDSFFSQARGGAQELPNGNVLITESDHGRAFEVTPDGDTVWEFKNDTWRDVDGRERRSAIYRMTRLQPMSLPD